MSPLELLCVLTVVVGVAVGTELCPRHSRCVIRKACRGNAYIPRLPFKCSVKHRGYVCCVQRSSKHPPTGGHKPSNKVKDKFGYGTPGYRMDYYDAQYESQHGGLSKYAKEILRSFRYKAECGVRNESPEDLARISSGYLPDKGITSFGEFPWHAALLVRQRPFPRHGYNKSITSYRYHCGATLLHRGLVLTAAHCVKGIKVNRLKVHLGDWNLRSAAGELFPAVERKVSRVFIHSGYNPATYLNDIALLQLDRPVDITKTPHISPACLPEDTYNFQEEKKCYIVGWGDDVYKPRFGSNILKATTVTYITDEDCADKLYPTLPVVHDYYALDKDLQKCIVGASGRDACVGDGGGAVVCPLDNNEGPDACHDHNCAQTHYFVAGIISFGSPVCGEGSVSVITDIVEHVNWIHTIIDPAGGLKNYDYDYYNKKNHYSGRSGEPTDQVTNNTIT